MQCLTGQSSKGDREGPPPSLEVPGGFPGRTWKKESKAAGYQVKRGQEGEGLSWAGQGVASVSSPQTQSAPRLRFCWGPCLPGTPARLVSPVTRPRLQKHKEAYDPQGSSPSARGEDTEETGFELRKGHTLQGQRPPSSAPQPGPGGRTQARCAVAERGRRWALLPGSHGAQSRLCLFPPGPSCHGDSGQGTLSFPAESCSRSAF